MPYASKAQEAYLGSSRNKADKARWQRKWRSKNQDKVRKAWKEWEDKNPQYIQTHIERNRRNHLMTEYGMSTEDYTFLFNQQKGLCALCGLPPNEKYLIVDHCHKTFKIRGLIHRKCNVAIGLLNDDVELLKLAVQYLQKHDSLDK